MTSWLAAQDDPVRAGALIRRFGSLIRATPSLRAHQSDMMDQFVAVAAAIIAGRAGMSPHVPITTEPFIRERWGPVAGRSAAEPLPGRLLWLVYRPQSLRRVS
jgi:hypothetical protein